MQRLLGEGAMAAVYLVRHTTLNTRCALKLLTYSRSKRVKDRMIQEGQTQARLQHPNILQVFDVFDVDGMPALLLEYVDGPSLHEALNEELLPLDEAEAIFRGIVAGVQAAHAEGLVHRDLKPANILLQPAPDGPVPKVADFGLAKAWADDDAPSHTRAGTAMGTPQYMAPEQATNAKAVDHRADVFALGCILYELVCGRRAFDGENLPTIFNQVLTSDYPAPQRITPGLPDRFQQVIDGCLQVQLDRRLPDCATILAVLDGSPLTAHTAVPPKHPASKVTWSPDKLDLDDEPLLEGNTARATDAGEEEGSASPSAPPEQHRNTPVKQSPPSPNSAVLAPEVPESIPPREAPSSEPEEAAPSNAVPPPSPVPAQAPVSQAPTSAVPSAAPALFLGAALGLPALAGLGLMVLLVLGGAGAAAYALLSAEEVAKNQPIPGEIVDGPCGGPRGQVVGYAWAGNSLPIPQGGLWRLERDTNVRRTFPREENGHNARSEVVCVLRRGTIVHLDAPVEGRPGAIWVPIVAGSVEP